MFRQMLIFWFMLSSTAFADPISDFYDDPYIDMKSKSDLNFELLQKLITDHNLNTLESTLSYLSKKFPEFFSNYILMYHSRSLQMSSFKNPRAILFDRSGHFVFSFNGHPTQKGFNNLEVMHFIPEKKRFEFREINFSEFGERTPRVSQANPAKCMACHQSHFRESDDPRPNWEPYNIWPGAYGSLSGAIFPNDRDFNIAKNKGLEAEMLHKVTLEGKKLNEFMKDVRPHHPRYQFLSNKFKSSLTSEFTEIIAAPNALRMGRQMAEIAPLLMKYLKYSLLGLFQCNQLMVSKSQKTWLEASLKKIGRYFPLKPPPFEDHRERYSKEFLSTEIAVGLIYLFEPFGISTQDWSMDFQTNGRLAFANRFGVPGLVKPIMTMGYRAAIGNWEKKEMSCSEIGEQATKALKSFFHSPDFKKIMTQRDVSFSKQKQPLINRCIKCHEAGDYSIPQIPFSNEDKLRALLHQRSIFSHRPLIDEIKYRTGPYAQGHERMPMGAIPSLQQAQDLIKYLESL